VRLDLPCQLVTQKHRPAAAESPGIAIAASRWRALASPPVLERREEPRPAGCHPLTAESPIAIEPERGRRGREEDARLAQGACRCGIEQQRIAPWVASRQLPQHRGRNIEIANEWSARGGPPG